MDRDVVVHNAVLTACRGGGRWQLALSLLPPFGRQIRQITRLMACTNTTLMQKKYHIRAIVKQSHSGLAKHARTLVCYLSEMRLKMGRTTVSYNAAISAMGATVKVWCEIDFTSTLCLQPSQAPVLGGHWHLHFYQRLGYSPQVSRLTKYRHLIVAMRLLMHNSLYRLTCWEG